MPFRCSNTWTGNESPAALETSERFFRLKETELRKNALLDDSSRGQIFYQATSREPHVNQFGSKTIESTSCLSVRGGSARRFRHGPETAHRVCERGGHCRPGAQGEPERERDKRWRR